MIIAKLFNKKTFEGLPLDYFGQTNSSGEPHGIGRMIVHNKGLIEGMWQNSDPFGYSLKISSNGLLYVGKFQNGVPNGIGKQIHRQGHYYQGEWKDGK
jgi:hypothetical protein